MRTADIVALSIFASMLGAVVIWTLVGFGRICWEACRKESGLNGRNAKAIEACDVSNV